MYHIIFNYVICKNFNTANKVMLFALYEFAKPEIDTETTSHFAFMAFFSDFFFFRYQCLVSWVFLFSCFI